MTGIQILALTMTRVRIDKDPDPGSTAGYTFFTLSQGIGSSLEESRTIKALSRTLDPGAD